MSTKKVTTFLKLLFILAVVGGVSYQCFSSGYKHYETQAESGLNIPESARDINVYRAVTTWYCYDFKIDFEGYKTWVANYKLKKLSSVTKTTDTLISYSKKQSKILFKDNVEQYRAAWNEEDRGAYFIYVPSKGRAYYASHSR